MTEEEIKVEVKKEKKKMRIPAREDVRARLVLMAQQMAKGYSVRKAMKIAGVSPNTYVKYKDFVWSIAKKYNPNLVRLSHDNTTAEDVEEAPDEIVEEAEESVKKEVEKAKQKFGQYIQQPPTSLAPPPLDTMSPLDSLDALATQLENAIESVTRFQQTLQNIAKRVLGVNQQQTITYVSQAEPPTEVPEAIPEKPKVKVEKTPEATIPESDFEKLLTISKLIDRYKELLEGLRKEIEEVAKKFGYKLVSQHDVMSREEKEKLLHSLAEELGYELKQRLIPYDVAKKQALEEVKKEINKELEEKKIEATKELVREVIQGFFNVLAATFTGRVEKVPATALETETKIADTMKVLEKLIAGEEEEEGKK